MAKMKNALTQYFVGPTDGEADLELAKWISEVNDSTDETTEDTAYYDGDGTTETEVTAIKLGYEFVGLFDKEDPAQAFIDGLKYLVGDGRKINFKQVHADGTTLEGPATVTSIVTKGGAASDFEPFQCTIVWNAVPTVTPSESVPQG